MTEYFDYMCGDKLTTRVYFDLSKRKIIDFENYSEDLIERFFGIHSLEDLCWDDLILRLENRTFSKYRPDVDIILE